MAKPGKLILKLFKDKEVDILINCFSEETLEFGGYSIGNRYVLSGLVIAYHEDCGILELQNHAKQPLYLSEDYIDAFYAPGFNILSSLNTIIKTGKQLKKPFKE
jgi:hypothetical protein